MQSTAKTWAHRVLTNQSVVTFIFNTEIYPMETQGLSIVMQGLDPLVSISCPVLHKSDVAVSSWHIANISLCWAKPACSWMGDLSRYLLLAAC